MGKQEIGPLAGVSINRTYLTVKASGFLCAVERSGSPDVDCQLFDVGSEPELAKEVRNMPRQGRSVIICRKLVKPRTGCLMAGGLPVGGKRVWEVK